MVENRMPPSPAVPAPPNRMVVGAVLSLAGACVGFTAGYLVGRERPPATAVVTASPSTTLVPATPAPPMSAPSAPVSAVTPPPPAPAPDPEVKARHDADVDRWIRQLEDPASNAGEAFAATHELKALSDLRAVPALVETLRKHEDFYARIGAASALGAMKACDAVPALIEALDGGEQLVKAAAGEALVDITGRDTKSGPNAAGGPSGADWLAWWRRNESTVRRGLGQGN